MPDQDALDALQEAVDAARAKLNHQDRTRAAEERRNRAWLILAERRWSASKIEYQMRSGLIKAGLSEADVDRCGVSSHNIKSAMRAYRR